MSTSTPTARAEGGVEELLARSRPDRPRGLSERELRVELALAALVAGGALAAAVALPSARSLDVGSLVAGVFAFAVCTHVRLYVGGGSALATQLVFVPLLFLLPLGLVPLVVVVALVCGALPEVLAGRQSPSRLLTAVGDAGYAFAPVVVLSAAGEPDAATGQWAVLAAAFAAQIALDCVLSVGREWLGRGIRPSLQLRVMLTVYAVDATLVPAGLVTATAAAHEPLGVLATLPLALLLAALARDRTQRVNAALDRLDEVERERERVRVAIHRTARSLGYSLDRDAMLEVALGTAVDAVAGTAGRARLAGALESSVFEAVPARSGDADSEALLSVERAALAGDATASSDDHGLWAIGRPLLASRDPVILGALAVCRTSGPFSREQSELLAYLAAQTAASIEAIDLHERLRNPDLQDELTGLANHRRFRDLLHADVQRACASGRPLSVLVVELDDLRRLNAEHGFAAGDEALLVAAAVMRAHTGADAARIGAGTLAAVLTGADLDACAAAGREVQAALLQRGLSASVGVADASRRLTTPEALIAGAEAACRQARAAGEGRLAAFRGPYA
ncbi:GGDEF domain-containing protein [Solirubrobacter sp. CPCC 204708]|uniref:GGDEF domain-containing protein n=1 Tax=Solirubrobacter deserti TaxID=2282478 RepID=A0ABT4RKD4_9ACTN|nr:GGDEF domain-containing protein [Solirubrobacter deserti]MBE2317286.1 GGDEF domain-containing protein [Solirubrobacter deserti]MDA0139017.1 GGDEF domain-containing protein [Solirubrobacter deserti]